MSARGIATIGKANFLLITWFFTVSADGPSCLTLPILPAALRCPRDRWTLRVRSRRVESKVSKWDTRHLIFPLSTRSSDSPAIAGARLGLSTGRVLRWWLGLLLLLTMLLRLLLLRLP